MLNCKRSRQLTSVDVEGDLNLRDTLGRGGNADEVKVTKELVISYEFTFTLVDFDLDSSLAISSSQENLRLLHQDGSVTANEFGHDSTESFDTCAQRVRRI